MRSIKTLLGIVLLFTTISIKAISLQDAISKKLISVTIGANDSESSYYGDCIKLSIKNKSTKELKIELLAGMFLMPEDSSIQRMMVAEQMIFALNASADKEVTINAFCTQMHNSSPSESTIFKVGKMAKGHLLGLAKLISKHKFFSKAGQNAIWCITDGQELYNINSNNESETKILREFVSKATNQALKIVYNRTQNPTEDAADIEENNEPQIREEQITHYSSSEEITVKDTVSYPNREGGKYTLILYTAEGDELVVFFKDRYKRPTNRTTLRFSISYTSFPAGSYFIRLTRDNAEVIYNKEIIITESE